MFTKLCLVWHKARNKMHLLRIEITCNDLLNLLADHYTTRSAQWESNSLTKVYLHITLIIAPWEVVLKPFERAMIINWYYREDIAYALKTSESAMIIFIPTNNDDKKFTDKNLIKVSHTHTHKDPSFFFSFFFLLK